MPRGQCIKTIINEKIKDIELSRFVSIYQDYIIPAGVLTTDEWTVDKTSMEILIKQLILGLIFEDQYKDCHGPDTYLEFTDLEGLLINRTGNVISVYYGYLYDWEFSIAPEDVLCDFIKE